MLHSLPDDALQDVFSADVLRRLRKTPNPSEQLSYRLDVLTGSAPSPSDVSWCRAQRAAWEAYLRAAFSCGLFEGEHGADLRSRLVGANYDNYRSAMAECMVCWVLAEKFQFSVRPKPAGRKGKVLDLLIEHPCGEIHVEVKAPHRSIVGNSWCGDDAEAIEGCVAEANKQFGDDNRNILVIVPNLRVPVSGRRFQLVRALYGEERFGFEIDRTTGESSGKFTKFDRTGKFMKVWNPERNPRHTRVSAVVCVEEPLNDEIPDGRGDTTLDVWGKHSVLVAHNPSARNPISRSIWGTSPQFPNDEGCLGWTDGRGLYP